MLRGWRRDFVVAVVGKSWCLIGLGGHYVVGFVVEFGCPIEAGFGFVPLDEPKVMYDVAACDYQDSFFA